MTKKILSEISAGELLDKISILEIKLKKVKDKNSQEVIKKEYKILKEIKNSSIELTGEIEEAKKIESIIITNNNKSLNIMELAGLITKASYVVANDTGPAHMTAHLGQMGTVLFGRHTTAKKVSIETDKFKVITTDDLNSLSAEKVYSEIKNKLELID